MKSCLIVDDSKLVRKMATGIINELGLKPIEASDGKEALDKCHQEIPDCILLDWNMPIMDGLEFIKNLRQHKQFDEVVVIFCTSENDIRKIQIAIDAGANEYIMKPFDKDLVRVKLAQTNIL